MVSVCFCGRCYQHNANKMFVLVESNCVCCQLWNLVQYNLFQPQILSKTLPGFCSSFLFVNCCISNVTSMLLINTPPDLHISLRILRSTWRLKYSAPETGEAYQIWTHPKDPPRFCEKTNEVKEKMATGETSWNSFIKFLMSIYSLSCVWLSVSYMLIVAVILT